MIDNLDNPLNKVFDPFIANTPTGLNDDVSFHSFERIKNNCTFHLPNQIQHIIGESSNNLNVIHINARSIVNKLDDLCCFLNETNTKWDLISISETWLSQSIEDNYNISGFHALFCGRISGHGGGSAIYVADHLCPERLCGPAFTTAEVVCASIKHHNIHIIICQIYRSPNSNKCLFNNELEKYLIWLTTFNRITLITGDFNFDLFSVEQNSSDLLFLTTQLSHGFFPTISRTTRASPPSFTLIDNIYSNDLSRVVHSGVILNDLSDHFPIFLSLKLKVNPATPNMNKYMGKATFDYRKINEFNIHLSQNLQNITNQTCPEDMANRIIEVYNEGIRKFSYIKHLSRKHSPRMPWISPAILHSITHKNKLFKEKLSNPSLSNITKYNRYRNILTRVIRDAKRKYYLNELNKHADNSKETWNTLQALINSKKEIRDAPSKLIDSNGNSFTEDSDIAEIFNNFFTEIGENLRKDIPHTSLDPLQYISYVENELQLDDTDEIEIRRIVNNLNNVGAGVDNINSKLFKLSYLSILHPLLHFLNTCLRQGIFPSALKVAMIKPIFKNGDPHQVNNYRPISILPVMSKLLEKIIYHRLVNHMNEQNIIHETQFGFQKNKSTYMPILLLHDMVTKAFEEGEFTLCLFLDIKKAFDTVKIDLLLKKLNIYGIRHTALKMLSSYLSDRTQSVVIGSTHSNFKPITMGVPQGSVLGPILFLLYINDFPKISPHMTCLSYADDTAILKKRHQ